MVTVDAVAEYVAEKSRAMQRHRVKRRKLGLCGWNGCKTAPPTVTYRNGTTGLAFYCPEHAEKHRQHQKKYRKECAE